MKDFLRNSRPLPYKTLATGILFNEVIEYHKEDVNSTGSIVINSLKDGVTILYFNKGIEAIATTENPVKVYLMLKNYSRVIFGPVYMSRINDMNNLFRTLSYSDNGGNEASIIIAKNKVFVQQWDITIDGKEYKDGMPVLINKIGGLIFVEFYTEI